ncbi:hypothetical protein [Stenotrophomonas sp. NRRL B-14846]|uniref:hypothetical protein n=1 Tax=Stenotrophomonas sp. NRRL B-14846 TaxID=3162882 RepID=UPI003D2B02BA
MFPRFASFLILGLCSSGALAADATYRPSFHPDQLKGPPAGRPNEVLVLGTTHLSGLPKSFQPALLEPLLQRLVAWKPELIATEDLSGLQCDFMRPLPGTLCRERGHLLLRHHRCAGCDRTGRAYGEQPRPMRLLATWPKDPAPAPASSACCIVPAAGERGSAQVQWLRLPAPERKGGDGTDTGPGRDPRQRPGSPQ